MSVLISCEVGGDQVPSQWVHPKFLRQEPIKASPTVAAVGSRRKRKPGQLPPTLTWDQPARYVAERMTRALKVPLITNAYSNDLIDVTRSLHHRQLFPTVTRDWPEADRTALIETIYEPYRREVRSAIRKGLDRWGYLIHVSIRSFDLKSKGKPRRADAGLLYDPARDDEVDFCLDWIDEMYEEIPMLRVRRNYPGRGTTDRLTKAMRTEFADENYLGIDLMINRAWAARPVAIRDEAIDGISWTLRTVTEMDQAEAA
ncbi:MAG: N-formylglutamate amidohydrolase [Rubripirellula sp.]